jgi:hypothetical protein
VKEPLFLTILLLTPPTLALAGNGDSLVQPQFYFFTAPIVSNTRYYYNAFAPACSPLAVPASCTSTARGGNNTGFGGELLGRKGLGVGIELGYGGPNWSFNGNGAIGVGSVNGSYHFFSTHSGRRVDPFVSGGYSLYFGYQRTFQSGFNLGGGVNLWFIKHAALRLEIRDQDGINRFDQFTRFAAFRFGMTFRSLLR